MVPIRMQTKHNKYVVNQMREHFDDISVSELFGRTRVGFFVFFLQNKMCPLLRKCICIYVDRSFFHETQFDQF